MSRATKARFYLGKKTAGSPLVLSEQQGYLYIAVAHDSWFNVFEVQDRLLILAATLIIVTLLCALLVWSLIRPIRQLQRNVRRLASGDFNLDEIRQPALRRMNQACSPMRLSKWLRPCKPF